MLRPVLGALEVKAISRLAALHVAEWKPLHTAVLGCLLAHRNRRTGSCFPERRLLAAHCNVNERTIDRALEQLTAWGAIERQQPRALASQQFREVQYTFLFELPEVLNTCEKNCENPSSRATKSPIAVRQKQVEPCDKIDGAVRQNRGPNKEEEKDLEAKDLEAKSSKGRSKRAPPPAQKFHSDACQQCGAVKNSTPGCQTCADLDRWVIESGLDRDPMIRIGSKEQRPQYTQQDFDERDWRNLNREIATIREGAVGNALNGPDSFRYACQRAGISVRRGYELWGRMMKEETG